MGVLDERPLGPGFAKQLRSTMQQHQEQRVRGLQHHDDIEEAERLEAMKLAVREAEASSRKPQAMASVSHYCLPQHQCVPSFRTVPVFAPVGVADVRPPVVPTHPVVTQGVADVRPTAVPTHPVLTQGLVFRNPLLPSRDLGVAHGQTGGAGIFEACGQASIAQQETAPAGSVDVRLLGACGPASMTPEPPIVDVRLLAACGPASIAQHEIAPGGSVDVRFLGLLSDDFGGGELPPAPAYETPSTLDGEDASLLPHGVTSARGLQAALLLESTTDRSAHTVAGDMHLCTHSEAEGVWSPIAAMAGW